MLKCREWGSCRYLLYGIAFFVPIVWFWTSYGVPNRGVSFDAADIFSIHIENNFPSRDKFVSDQVTDQVSEGQVTDQATDQLTGDPVSDQVTDDQSEYQTDNDQIPEEYDPGDQTDSSDSNNSSSEDFIVVDTEPSEDTPPLPEDGTPDMGPPDAFSSPKIKVQAPTGDYGNTAQPGQGTDSLVVPTSGKQGGEVHAIAKLPEDAVENAMDVILGDGKRRKPTLIVVDEAVHKAVKAIDDRIGIAPKQDVLRRFTESMCKKLGLNGTMVEKPRLAYFNKEHKLLYVGNPKCGSTSFKKFLLRLGGDTRDYSEMTSVHNEETNDQLKSLWNETLEFQEEVLQTYYKVTFVRNPLVRLVSGYRNKIVRVPRDHYITIIQEIISKHYGAEQAIHWLPRHKYRPSFEQFVEYLLEEDHATKNYHWAPYADNIQLCGFSYDLIAQLETANQQIQEMKTHIPSLNNVPFPMSRTELSVDGYSSEQLATLAFSNLTDILRDKVYSLYEKEIKLLGYTVIGDAKFPYINLTDVHIVPNNG